MGDLEGVGRIYRPELNPNIDRPRQIDPTSGDRKGRSGEEKRQGGESEDTVELHEIEEASEEPQKNAGKPKAPKPNLDVSA